MKKLKEKVLNLCLTIKRIYKSFPITTFIIAFLTIVSALNMMNDNLIGDGLLHNISTFSIVLSFGTLLIESLEAKKSIKIVSFLVAIIMASIFAFCSKENEVMNPLLSHFYICYMVSIFAATIFFNCRKSSREAKNSFGEYLTAIFIKTLKATFIYSILSLGTLLIATVFIFLILDGAGSQLISVLETFIFGLFYIPSLIDALCQTEKVPKTPFYRFIIKYLFETLLLIAFTIIYLYLLKIILKMTLPSNQIFPITAALFIIGLPIWTMAKSFDEGKTIDKINHYLPALFIPFIALQICSMGIRIFNYGVTESRYLAILLILFEICYIIIYFVQNKKQENLIIIFIIFTIIATIVPYINMYKVSELSQYHHLKLIAKENPTKKEQTKIIGAYYYLKEHNFNQYIDNLTESELEKIENFEGKLDEDWEDWEDNDDVLIYVNDDIDLINVDGYKKLYMIDVLDYDCEKKIENVFKNFEVKIENSNEQSKFTFNILSNMLQYIEYEQQEILEEEFPTINQIQLDANKTLLLKHVSLDYDQDTKIVSSYQLEGYLLVK